MNVFYHPHTPNRRPKCGITLVELLAVIAIIGILAGVIIPTVSHVREAARGSTCLSNLRQIGAAHQLYVADHGGHNVPVATGTSANDMTWRGILLNYLGNSHDPLRCPSDGAATEIDDSNAKFLKPPSYGINNSDRDGNVDNAIHDYMIGASSTKLFSIIKNPSRLIFVSDIGVIQNPSSAPDAWMQDESKKANYGYASFPNKAGWPGSDWTIFPRHKDKANVVFYDGHVDSIRMNALSDHPIHDPMCIYRNQ